MAYWVDGLKLFLLLFPDRNAFKTTDHAISFDISSESKHPKQCMHRRIRYSISSLILRTFLKGFQIDTVLKVVERSDSTVTVEEDVHVAGREIHQITRHTFEPKRFLRSAVIDGDTKGTIVEITLDS